MGTRADFYIGRGANAEWLGSIAFDGYPGGIDKQLLNCTSEAAFRHALAAFLQRDDATHPADGWPWPWDDSTTTDYAYAFDGETVYGSCFGRAWFDATKPKPESDEGEENKAGGAIFPNMKERKKVTYGKRSGLLVLSFK